MGANDKLAATFGTGPASATCKWCGQSYGTDDVARIHQGKCPMRPEGAK